MDSSNLPPPLPGKKKSSVWPFIAAGMGFVVLMTLVALAAITLQRMKAKQAAARTALSDIQKSSVEAREKIADAMEKGEVTGSDEVIGRMKEQLEKSAGHLSGDDAAASRAMAAYLSKMQMQAREYEAALGRLISAEVLSFNLQDRSTLEAHRKLVREFAAANDQLTDTVRHAEELARTELKAAKVSARMLEATMTGFNKGREQRQLQLRIRDHDRTLGEAGLGALDLLDKNWGRWSHDKTSGQLRFEDDAALASFNTFITTIQTAAAEQTQVQQELVEKVRAMNRP